MVSDLFLFGEKLLVEAISRVNGLKRPKGNMTLGTKIKG